MRMDEYRRRQHGSRPVRGGVVDHALCPTVNNNAVIPEE